MTYSRFGSRSVPGQHASTPGRVHGIVPGNAGIARAAQDRVNALSSAASRKLKEAISGIDAVRLYIWQPLKHGPACNCGTQPLVPVEPEEPSNPYTLGIIEDQNDQVDDFKPVLRVKTHDVTAYDHHLRVSPTNRPDHNYSQADILGDEVIPPRSSTGGTTDPYAPGSTSTGPRENYAHGEGHIYLHGGEYDHEVPDTKAEDEFGEELLSEYERDGWNPDSILADSAYVLGSMQATCPVCFGTGILGGYSLFGATRLVLSSANATGGLNLGTEDGQPPYYTLDHGEYVEWTGLSCPNYFSFGWALARNGRKVTDIDVTFSLDNGDTWLPIRAISTVNNVNLTGLIIRATNETDSVVSFTHADVTLFHTEVLGQVTNFMPEAGVSVAIRGQGITITLPPEVGMIDRNSLIGDSKYRLMWRVISLEPISTAMQQVISLAASTELMEPSLVETILYPHYSVEGKAQMIYGNGVEPIQGVR